MSTLFFEGFNINNNDNTKYLDNKYWSKPYVTDPVTPVISFNSNDTQIASNLTSRFTSSILAISGARTFTSPAQFQTPLQLSGIADFSNSSGVFFSFRSAGLTHAPTSSSTFPHAQKLIAICKGDNEEIIIEAVLTTGQPPIPGWVASTGGLGFRIKQSGSIIGLFDTRVNGISGYTIQRSDPNLGFQQSSTDGFVRAVHHEFFFNISGNQISMRIEGIDNVDSITNQSYVSISQFTFDNIKFYNRLANATMIDNNFKSSIFPFNAVSDIGGYIYYDDIVLCNTTGESPKSWMGEQCRVLPYAINDRVFAGFSQFGVAIWVNNTVLSSGWSRSRADFDQFPVLDSRDGDNTYISSSSSGTIFSVLPYASTSFPLRDIGGIKMHNEARKTQLDSFFTNVYGTGSGTPSGSYVNLGENYFVNLTRYDMFTSFAFLNPITNQQWTSGQISSGVFGFKKL